MVRKHLSLWRDMATCRDMATGAQSLISSFQTQPSPTTPPSGPQGEPGGKSYPLHGGLRGGNHRDRKCGFGASLGQLAGTAGPPAAVVHSPPVLCVCGGGCLAAGAKQQQGQSGGFAEWKRLVTAAQAPRRRGPGHLGLSDSAGWIATSPLQRF